MATTSIVMIVRLALRWFSSLGKNEKISQELRMRSKSLSEYQSLTLNVMTQVSQFVRNNQLFQAKLCFFGTEGIFIDANINY